MQSHSSSLGQPEEVGEEDPPRVPNTRGAPLLVAVEDS